jgi:peptidoglycan/xylan/chitin deacetylase (PgdA/CDA1 family)/CelD/BcsL family acetyltransferase involved in cellulose biosynthesis
MRVAEIRTEEEFQQLKPTWDELVNQSASKSIFITWEWVWTWWRAYGVPGDLFLLVFSDEDATARGVAPLRRKRLRKYGQKVETISFVGDSSFDSDYLDFIVAAGYEERVIEAFHAHCAGLLADGAMFELNEMPEISPHFPLLRELADSRKMAWTAADVPCATLRLPGDWEAYLKMLQPRFRTKVRSVLRNLESRPEVRFRFCEDPAELDRILPILFDLHTRRWAAEGQPGVFGWERKRYFYARLSRILLDRGWLRLSWLEWNSRVLACQYGFAFNGTYSQLQEGYEPASEHWHPGVALRAWTIREFLKQGLREYDFLGGVGRHKTTWGAEVKNSKRIVLAGVTYKNLLARCGPGWDTAGRDLIRKVIPKKVAATRAHAQPVTAHGPVVRLAAAVYHRSGLGRFTRGLRDRYQISIDAGSGWRMISCHRRQKASARILYYHRVNDANDPFIGAISRQTFEVHMSYLARHHKVVSVAEVMQRLEQRESFEPVVAVTFDDGYEDNYRNAFPILRRYGLPATIFLTTGNIDSREPLWFQQLAIAVKVSPREYIDLEHEIPRRFWLRTEAERLAANAGIFRILRQMDDGRRRGSLKEILGLLDAPPARMDGDGMLSWEQIRLMKVDGIDFGGHTVTHPFLSKLTPQQAYWEVFECKRRIEEELQQPVEYFAYPNGREEDFAAPNKDALRAAGYRAAMTTIWGVNDHSTDRMELRRGGPWETDPALFAFKLDWYQWANQ